MRDPTVAQRNLSLLAPKNYAPSHTVWGQNMFTMSTHLSLKLREGRFEILKNVFKHSYLGPGDPKAIQKLSVPDNAASRRLRFPIRVQGIVEGRNALYGGSLR